MLLEERILASGNRIRRFASNFVMLATFELTIRMAFKELRSFYIRVINTILIKPFKYLTRNYIRIYYVYIYQALFQQAARLYFVRRVHRRLTVCVGKRRIGEQSGAFETLR